MSELLDALRVADSEVPSALETFDRVATRDDARPDFFEHSMRVDGSSPYRLTYYFDVHRRGKDVARMAGARFVELSRELGAALPPALEAFVGSDATSGPEVLQVVLGVDAPSGGALVRCKYYLVFRGDPGDSLASLLAALALETPAKADLHRGYIVGIDVTAAGVEDVKLYFRLDRTAVPRAFDAPPAIAALVAESRDVVLQQCIRRPERRQAYMHASSTEKLASWLAKHESGESARRATAINAALHGARLKPWIVSFACTGRRLAASQGAVYYHLAPAGPGAR
jgi:hypothetical protein